MDQQLIQQQEWLLNLQKDLVREVMMMDQLLVTWVRAQWDQMICLLQWERVHRGHLQVKGDLLQAIWRVQVIWDQADHLQVLIWMETECLHLLQVICLLQVILMTLPLWLQALQVDQIHCLVMLGLKADHPKVIQADLLQVIQ